MAHVLVLFIMFVILMALGVPIAVSLFISSVVYIKIFNLSFLSAIAQMIAGPMSTTLLATGFFILSGNLMNNGGVTRKIFGFCDKLVGWVPGGLGHANVLASVIFAGMSGTASSDAGGLGQIEVKAMTDNGFDLPFSAAVTGASTVLGPIIPPSVPAVMFAVITGVSTGRLFAAGLLPGVLAAASMMLVVFSISRKRGYKRNAFPKGRDLWNSFKASLFPLLSPVIILGCIYTGIVTPSEAAVVAALYAIILGLTSGDMKFKDLPRIFKDTVKILTSTLFIIVTAKLFSYIIAEERIPAMVSKLILSHVASPQVALLIFMAILLICGALIDNASTIYIVTPVFYPIAVAMGIDPVHFGMVFIFTLMIGVVTPPFGTVLFMLQTMTDVDIVDLIKELIPFIVVLVIDALIIAFVPALSTALPNLIYGVTG